MPLSTERVTLMKSRTCCFSGHRSLPQCDLEQIAERTKEAIVASIQDGYCFFDAGGALGFDTLAAKAVLELKILYPEIKLILVLPCKDQSVRWNAADITEYERIKSSADKVVYTSEHYYNGCMQKRNRHLVDNSSLCICYLSSKTGGTAYTVDYAKKNGCRVINLA